LKSTYSRAIWPGSCEPTSTVSTGCTVPVAVMTCSRAPRWTGAVMNGPPSGGGGGVPAVLVTVSLAAAGDPRCAEPKPPTSGFT
jgi:hypothetical protein